MQGGKLKRAFLFALIFAFATPVMAEEYGGTLKQYNSVYDRLNARPDTVKSYTLRTRPFQGLLSGENYIRKQDNGFGPQLGTGNEPVIRTKRCYLC